MTWKKTLVAVGLVVSSAGVFATMAIGSSTIERGRHRALSVVGPAVTIPSLAQGGLSRRWRKVRWDTISSLSGRAFDTLRSPRILAANRSALAVVDGGQKEIAVFDRQLRKRWALPLGGGRLIRRLQWRGDTLLALDATAGEVLAVVPPGRTVHTTVVRGAGSVDSFDAPSGKDLIAIAPLSQPAFIVLDTAGRTVAPIDISWKEFYSLNPLLRSGSAASQPNGRRWVFALTFGNGWLAFDGTTALPYLGRYFDAAVAPSVVVEDAGATSTSKLTRNTESIFAVAMARDTLFALRAMRDSLRGRVLDLYDTKTGDYAASYRLPFEARSFTVEDQLFYFVTTAPGSIVVLRR